MRFQTSNKRELEPTKTPTSMDIAWAAGIYEGEGSCARGGNGSKSFVVSVSQKDPEMLYRLRDFFGGSVKEYDNNFGTVASKNQPFTIYAWRVCGNRARVFLAVIYSWLTARRKSQIDATRVREFLDFVGNVPREDGLAFVMARLDEHIAKELVARKQRKKEYEKNFYARKNADPDYMEKRREQTRAWRRRSKIVAIA